MDGGTCATRFGDPCPLLGRRGCLGLDLGEVVGYEEVPLWLEVFTGYMPATFALIVSGPQPRDILLIHDLDDFLSVPRDSVRQQGVTGRVAARL